jgi:aryl-alcohol dehydrogenase-like predicted oxidoreductase
MLSLHSTEFLLGTAQWGWTVPASTAYALLDAWLKAGQRAVDIATNYPINKNSADFRAAESILLSYISAHGLENELTITMKVGSMDNLRTPDCNLSPSYLMMMAAENKRQFRGCLASLMLHWDNRNKIEEIRASFTALSEAANQLGFRPGLSGIAQTAVYAALLNGYAGPLDIQLKHNVLQSDLTHYSVLMDAAPQSRVFAYGINAGGIKLDEKYDTESTFLTRGGKPDLHLSRLDWIRAHIPAWNAAFVRPPIKSMNHLGLIFAGINPRINGMVLGFRDVDQLHESLDFWRNLETFDYSEVWKML